MSPAKLPLANNNLSFKGNDTSLIFSSNPVYLFNSLSRLLNPTVNLLKLFNLSKN
jgi:hypothetical protein